MMELKSSSHQTIILSGLTFAENKQSVKQSKMFLKSFSFEKFFVKIDVKFG